MRILFALMFAVLALAGCAETAEPAADTDSVDEIHDESGNHTAALDLIATLDADAINGTAPLMVNFTLDGNAPNATWSLDFGDDNSTDGFGLPGAANHTFDAGNFTVVLTVIDGNQTVQSSLNLTVLEVVEEVRELPEQLHFEFGESLGCVGDFAVCVGPALGEDGLDGFWVPLSELYWGLSLTTTVDNVLGDSDCYFVNDAGDNIGNGNNGGSECAGTVPEGAVQMYLYSYAEPALHQTATFSL